MQLLDAYPGGGDTGVSIAAIIFMVSGSDPREKGTESNRPVRRYGPIHVRRYRGVRRYLSDQSRLCTFLMNHFVRDPDVQK